MSSKPFIGITTDMRVATRTKALYSCLHSGYYDNLATVGAVPVIIPPLAKEEELLPIVELLDGIVLAGASGDVHPRRMGQSLRAGVEPVVQRLEDSDIALCKIVLRQKLPLLAIGYGMQLLNVLLGGNLYAHLPEDLPRALPHFDRFGGVHRHLVEITPGTRLEEIYGCGEILVNSSHHQAIRKVAPGLRVAAVAPDGVAEAVESEDPDWFCIAVQWHPETETASALDRQLFEALLNACRVKTTVRMAA
jgi:putative glutamine amidotransferase